MQGHAALLAGSSILVQNTLVHSLVDSHDSSLVGSSGSSLITAGNGSLKLLNGSLQSGLVGLVLLVSDLGRNDILLGGLNVGHDYTSYSPIWSIQIYIIARHIYKINPYFKKISGFFGFFYSPGR
jgi:hypothetical protein